MVKIKFTKEEDFLIICDTGRETSKAIIILESLGFIQNEYWNPSHPRCLNVYSYAKEYLIERHNHSCGVPKSRQFSFKQLQECEPLQIIKIW